MPLDHAFRFSSILLAATGFASLTLAIALPLWLIVLVSGTFVMALLRVQSQSAISGVIGHLRFSALTWNIFLLLAFAGFWIDLFLVSQELLPAGIHFLVLLLANKLSNLDQRRDFLHLYAISLIALLASAALTTQIWYAPFFFVFLVIGVWTLLLYHLLQEQEEMAEPQHAFPVAPSFQLLPHLTLRFFWTTNVMAAGAFALTLLFFFLIPRVGVGFFQNNHGESLRTTGFSEHVDLGVIGPVKQDPSIVMRVELPDRTGHDSKGEFLYLRGVAYNRYDGKSWSNSLLHRRMLTEFPEGTFTLRTPDTKPSAAARQLRQEILLEPLDTTVLFGTPFPTSVKGHFLSVQSDLTGSLSLPYPLHTRSQYTVYSSPTTLNAAEKQASALLYPDFILQQYLQVPVVNEQILELARQITRPATSIAQAVALVHTHLLTHYRYNLDVPSLQSSHPLEDFLLTRKTGYCEHYATAMVVMLRTVGIPARLVTGFLATEWNEFGGYYTVRQRDAHAWVEVYFPQSGWITMDPTPPSPDAAGATWLQSANSAMDSIRLQWDRLFVHYSAHDQFTVVQGIREGGEAVRAGLAETLSALSAQSAAILGRVVINLTPAGVPHHAVALLLTLAAGYGGMRILRWFQNGTARPRVFSTQQQTVITLYTSMLQCCAQRGSQNQQARRRWNFSIKFVRDGAKPGTSSNP
jgi:transglutaminase-like putative cysteine protease